MLTRLDDAKSEVLDRAAEVGEHSRASGRPLGTGERESAAERRAFLERYYRHVPADDLIGRDPVDVFGVATSHRQLAAARQQGTSNVRVFTPTLEEHGWSSGHTVVEVVTDDMPFLVDSVVAELTREDRSIHLIVHPQMVVRRELNGELAELPDIEASAAADGDRHRVLDPRRDRPGDRRFGPRAAPGVAAPGARRRSGRRRGLGEDARHRRAPVP